MMSKGLGYILWPLGKGIYQVHTFKTLFSLVRQTRWPHTYSVLQIIPDPCSPSNQTGTLSGRVLFILYRLNDCGKKEDTPLLKSWLWLFFFYLLTQICAEPLCLWSLQLSRWAWKQLVLHIPFTLQSFWLVNYCLYIVVCSIYEFAWLL